jgi:GMP synthase PP-ATPase subunit
MVGFAAYYRRVYWKPRLFSDAEPEGRNVSDMTSKPPDTIDWE